MTQSGSIRILGLLCGAAALQLSGCGSTYDPALDPVLAGAEELCAPGSGDPSCPGARPVALFYVKAASRFEGQGGPGLGRFWGFIEVENLAYHKQVQVHYHERQSEGWQDVDAHYVKGLPNNKELWAFASPEHSYPARLSADFQFALRYQVAGQVFWDNNKGQDYRIATGARTVFPADLVLGKSQIALRKVNAYNGFAGTNAEGVITLKNLAYDKKVVLRYSTDSWQTWREARATYGHPLSDDSEEWYFNFFLEAGYGQVLPLDFAIRYEVAGHEIWDNNFGDDYHLDTPGSLE